MRKKSLIAILVLAFGAMISTSAINPAEAYIDAWNWLGQVHFYDPYWGSYYVRVFPEDSIATLTVRVYNPSFTDLNVSTVEVSFDWNGIYSSTECSEANPLVVEPWTYHLFTITFTVPSTSTASNLVRHAYTIEVEEVNATTGPKQTSVHDRETGSDFVVYSTIQKDAQRLYDEINMLFDIYGYSPYFSSLDAQSLWANGTAHYELGYNSHVSGDFTSAEAHYDSALDAFYEAISTELSYDLDWQEYEDDLDRQWDSLYILEQQAQIAQLQGEARMQEAFANATLKEAEAAMMQANATMREADAQFAIAEAIKMQANALVVFGIGFIVFGFAAVVWAYRRPIRPPS